MPPGKAVLSRNLPLSIGGHPPETPSRDQSICLNNAIQQDLPSGHQATRLPRKMSSTGHCFPPMGTFARQQERLLADKTLPSAISTFVLDCPFIGTTIANTEIELHEERKSIFGSSSVICRRQDGIGDSRASFVWNDWQTSWDSKWRQPA